LREEIVVDQINILFKISGIHEKNILKKVELLVGQIKIIN